MYHTKIHQTTLLSDDEYNNYIELMLKDSLWSLIDSNTKWNKADYYKTLWEKSIYIDPMDGGSKIRAFKSIDLKLNKKLKKKN